MIESYVIIVIGFGMDIVGAFLIINPFYHKHKYQKQITKQQKDELRSDAGKASDGLFGRHLPMSNLEKIKTIENWIVEQESIYPKLRRGLIIFFIGFMLQIIGNILQLMQLG